MRRKVTGVPMMQGLSARQKRRLYSSGVFLLGCVILVVVLSVQSCTEEKHSSLDSLISDMYDDESMGPPDDPLGIVAAKQGFELMGISENASVIGYFCALEPTEAAERIDAILRSSGWQSLGTDRADDRKVTPSSPILSFVYPQADGIAAFLFMQCIGVPGGCSVIVEVV